MSGTSEMSIALMPVVSVPACSSFIAVCGSQSVLLALSGGWNTNANRGSARRASRRVIKPRSLPAYGPGTTLPVG